MRKAARPIPTTASRKAPVDDPPSGVVLKPRARQESWPEVSALNPSASEEVVTLLVYVWRNAKPGVMSWVFPSARAALIAARTMKNAVRWMIVRGSETTSVSEARRSGFILFEETAFPA